MGDGGWGMGYIRPCPPPVQSRNGGHDASPGWSAPTHAHRLEPKGQYVIIGHYRTILDEVNALPLQYTLNTLNILPILAGNTDIALDLAVTILKNFKLKCDTIQTENYMPAR